MAEVRSASGLNYKTLLCTNIPELFLDKYVARTHFGRFGNLVNFVLRPRRMTCTVSYASEEEAALALREGKVYNGHQFEMSYAEIETAPAQKTEEWVDPDVQAELSALSAASWRSEYGGSKPNTYAGAIKAPPPVFAPSARVSNVSAGAAPTAVAAGNVERDKDREKERERQRAPAQFKAAKQELETVMRRPAYTSEEKYRVLDARDKLMRLNQRRGGSATNSKGLQGYCPDMCPEKERVLREFQRQVAVFEQQPDSDNEQVICHELALKQYSRSSADQETPLPHELRNEAALHMTMSYLMHEIMDICERDEAHLGDWFHFVWDRTRSIRKEITQQELCSLGAVKLVEQCARFHIHCAARLVAEDPSVFDTKINAENLTKCLQTLKYMYHDLRLKGVQCPREAEFRGYIVLLNLADANFLWDIGQLPAELQSCPQVRRAIQFYLALQDTNFVRFFQLLRDEETTYLEACILVGYFTRLRVLALQRLLSAYRAPRKYESFSLPVSYIRQMLFFPTDEEADEFLELCDLRVDESGRVTYTSIRIHPPEHYKLRRQFELVESKRQQSVGECICGETLPPKSIYRNHRPHNSFNDSGYLKSSAWTAQDQLPNGNSSELGDEPNPPAASVRAATAVVPSSNSSTIRDNLFKVPLFSAPISPKQKSTTPPPTIVASNNNKGGFSFNLSQQDATASRASSSSFSGNIFQSNLGNSSESRGFIFGLARPQSIESQPGEQHRQQKAAEEAKLAALQQAIAQAKQRELELLELKKLKAEQAERARQQRQLEQQLARQEEEQRQQAAEAAAAAAAAAAKAEAAARAEAAAAAAALRHRRQMQQQEKEEEQREAQGQQLFRQLLDEQLEEICAKELQLHRQAQRLYEMFLDQQVQQLVQRQMLRADYELGLMRHYWRRWRSYRRVQLHKDALFACLPLSFGADGSQQLVDMKSAEQPLRMMRRYRQGEPCDYRQLLAGMEDQCWLKLDLWELLARALQQQQPTPGARRFFKLLLSLPDGSSGHVMEHALDRGLLQRPLTQSPSDCVKPDSEDGYINGLSHGVALCVHKLKGNPERQHERIMANADGIVCYVDGKRLQEAQQRLHLLQRHSNCSYVALIVQQEPEQLQQQHHRSQLAKQLQLDELWRAYYIFQCSTLQQGRQKQQFVALLQHAVHFLAKQPHRSRSTLQQRELRDWLWSQLGDELFQRLREAVKRDATIGQRSRSSAQFCANLYNEAVRRLQLVVGESLEDRPQLPRELRAYVEPLAPQSVLPNRLEYFVPGWQTREERAKIVQLLEQIKLPEMAVPLPEDKQAICEWLLNYAQLSQQDSLVDAVALRAIQTLELQQHLGEINYLDIVEIFAKERLQFVLRRQLEGDEHMPRAIVYRRHTLHKLFETHWYYEWQPAEIQQQLQGAEEERLQQQQKQRITGEEQQEELSYEQVLGQAQAVLDKYQQRRMERKTLSDFNKLEQSMQRFDRTALAAMQEEEQQLQKQQEQEHHQQQQQIENHVPAMPTAKRQRLHAHADECADLLDRTERLIHHSQTSEQRRLQLLQRAKKFL